MPTLTTAPIATSDLIAKINDSLMGDEQKRALIAVLPRATETDRAQIVALIDKSNADAQQIQKDYEVKVGDINVKYKDKLDELVRVETRRARDTFEKMDDEKKVETVMALEHEMQTVSAAEAVSAVPTLATSEKRHPARWLAIALILLACGAAAAWVGLGVLTTP